MIRNNKKDPRLKKRSEEKNGILIIINDIYLGPPTVYFGFLYELDIQRPALMGVQC